MSVMGAFSDLDFAPGLDLQSLVKSWFSSTVSLPSSSSANGFFLVASFSRSTIRLDVNSVGLLLQSCLGGIDLDFRVQHLSGWMFHFTVCSKDVGFLIYPLDSFACKSFEVFFSLWGSGGPNWRKNYDTWIKEQDAEWTTVHRNNSSKHSYADAVKSRSVFKRLHYPEDYFSSNFESGGHVLDHGGRVLRPNQANFKLSMEVRDLRCDRRCYRCLSPDHVIAACRSMVRCRACFGYGHISNRCRASFGKQHIFRPKSSPARGLDISLNGRF